MVANFHLREVLNNGMHLRSKDVSVADLTIIAEQITQLSEVEETASQTADHRRRDDLRDELVGRVEPLIEQWLQAKGIDWAKLSADSAQRTACSNELIQKLGLEKPEDKDTFKLLVFNRALSKNTPARKLRMTA